MSNEQNIQSISVYAVNFRYCHWFQAKNQDERIKKKGKTKWMTQTASQPLADAVNIMNYALLQLSVLDDGWVMGNINTSINKNQGDPLSPFNATIKCMEKN